LFPSLRETIEKFRLGPAPIQTIGCKCFQRASIVGTFSNTIPEDEESGGRRPAFSDTSLQNERAMWWAEFDSVGEEAVRGYVERNSYTPTGMEVARQWLAQRELVQLREDVKSLKALAELAQATACESQAHASETWALAGQVDANSRAIAEVAANLKRNTRTMVFVGMAASLVALCAIIMMPSSRSSSLQSSQQAAPKQASAQPAKQAALPPQPPIAPPVAAPAAPPAQTRQAVPPAETQASAIPPENVQETQPSSQIASADLKPQGRSLSESLALIADKVGGEGAINFTAQFRDVATGRGHAEQLSYQASNVTIDPNRCQVGYHWRAEQSGRTVSDSDHTVEIRLARNVTVTSIDTDGRRFAMRADPKVYVVNIARSGSASGDTLYFRDQGTAARVGTAVRHAMQLCGNGESLRR
jgi:hypothetical protein